MIRMVELQIGESEREAVMAVLTSGRLANGPAARDLETVFAKEVSQTEQAVAVANGTAALHLALLAHDIGPGDEVITTPFSFQATANMILATGARPVFVDINEDGNIDPSKVEAAITTKTKAVLPVHLYGRLCEMTALCTVIEQHGLALIEDAAQAHRAESNGRRAGNFGTGCFSLYATKNLTAGEGGIVTCNDSDLAARLRRLRSHGEDERYESIELGYNYRMSETGAALALTQVPWLEERTLKRRHNAERLSQGLSKCSNGIQLPTMPAQSEEHVWHQYTIHVTHNRDSLQNHLRENGIESAVYYPKLLPEQKLYRDLGFDAETLPTARRLTAEVLSLPVHPGLSDQDIDHVIEAVSQWTGS